MNPHRKERNRALRKVAIHRLKRRWHLARGNKVEAAEHLQWTRRWRKKAQEALAALRKSRGRPRPSKPPVKYTFRSVKNFFTRPRIAPRLLVLHSTESSPGSGYNIGAYLSHGSTQADCHIVVDTDGTTYRLVPDARKAWHVGVSNGFSIGIEQVGRASQNSWPDEQLKVVARWLAYYSRRFDIPLVDARQNLDRGVVTHNSLPGDHWDPGASDDPGGGSYPFKRVLELARRY